MSKYGELGALTRGERLLIDRRRRGENQGEAAERLGLTRTSYGAMERDLQPDLLKPGQLPKIGKLEVHERCLLYRRRVGKTQEEVALELKCCRWTVNQMERGLAPLHDLVSYWEQ